MKKTRRFLLGLILGALLTVCFLGGIACKGAPTYKVIFKVNQTEYHTIKTSGKEQVTLPEPPTVSGYDFQGWFMDENTWQFPFDKYTLLNNPIKEDLIVYAKFLKALYGTEIGLEGFSKNNAVQYSLNLSYQTQTFNLVSKIRVATTSQYIITTDEQGLNVVTTSSVNLEIGANEFFVKVTDAQDNSVTYKLIVTRAQNPNYGATYIPIVEGQDTYYIVSGVQSEQIENLTILSEYNGKPVTKIASNAFRGFGALKTVTIPASVQLIGDGAFYGCENLTSVIMNYSTAIDGQRGVETISNNAFYGCSELTTVRLSAGLKGIGKGVFDGCDKLEYAEYDNAKYLGNAENEYLALIGAKDKNITTCIAHKFTRIIGIEAFKDCTLLERFEFDEAVIHNSNVKLIVGAYAFQGCIKLKSVLLPGETESIDYMAFDGCNELSTVFYLQKYYPQNDMWYGIRIALGNDVLTKNKVFYFSNTQPSGGNAWHFVEGIPTVWNI